jgi:hypothetical protein
LRLANAARISTWFLHKQIDIAGARSLGALRQPRDDNGLDFLASDISLFAAMIAAAQ